MEKCKYCEAELEENSSVCPKCGKDNAEEVSAPAEAEAPAEVPAEEEAPAEVPAEAEAPAEEPAEAETPAEVPAEAPAEEAPKKVSVGKTILAVTSVLVVLILLLAVVLNGRKPAEEPAPTAPTAPAVEATVPADGNPEDVTCKGTYTADDETVAAQRDAVVATAGDRTLTVGQLQVFYWMEFRDFMSQYGAYAAYFGLDVQQPLDTQVCAVMDSPMTWQQYFLGSALDKWMNYSAMAAAADEAGFSLSDEQLSVLDNLQENLEGSAVQNGFESAEAMLHASLGSMVTFDDYRYYMEMYLKANGYYGELAGAIDPTQEELEAFFQEHADGYAQSGVTMDSVLVDVRHILLMPEGEDTESEEVWAAIEASAQEILDQWLAGEATEDSFAALANEHSQDPGSNNNGGLYQDVYVGQMVQPFNDWCFDTERQVGDTGIVKTEYGYHIMYFVGSRPMWLEYAESDYIGETANAQATAIAEKDPLEAKYESILLCSVELF